MFGLNMSDAERENMVSELIETSMGSTKTYLYDTYQKYTNDIES
jgi:phosphatidylinositol kinase/protein kinase (PI-3  family)